MGANVFIYNMPATLELIADIDSPHKNVGLLADSFHWFTTGAASEDIAALSPEQIVHVHINDGRTSHVMSRSTRSACCPARALLIFGRFWMH